MRRRRQTRTAPLNYICYRGVRDAPRLWEITPTIIEASMPPDLVGERRRESRAGWEGRNWFVSATATRGAIRPSDRISRRAPTIPSSLSPYEDNHHGDIA